jgi:hypothetical protein
MYSADPALSFQLDCQFTAVGKFFKKIWGFVRACNILTIHLFDDVPAAQA